jgi:hypothetical protein
MLISWFYRLYRLIYYCDMREALKHLYSNQITLEDNSQFYYTINPYQLTNALGNIVAVLQEYNFTKKGDNNSQFYCKLYRTKEGNWYDMEEVNPDGNNAILRMLKLAVDTKENDIISK